MKRYETKNGEARAKIYSTIVGKDRIEFIEQVAHEMGVSVLMVGRIIFNEAIDRKMSERRTTCE